MKTFLLLVGLLNVASVQAEPADPVNGKRLFEESRCLECHSTDVFTKETRKVKSFAALESQVRRCDANLSANWFDDQILDVVAYLNQAFYKFPLPSANVGVGAEPQAGGRPEAHLGASPDAHPDAPADARADSHADAPSDSPADTHPE